MQTQYIGLSVKIHHHPIQKLFQHGASYFACINNKLE